MGEVSQSVFTPIIRAQEACFRLPTRRCVSKPHRFRCDGGRKSKPNFALMTPCKNRGGAGEMSESFFSWQTLNPRHPTHPAGLSGRESGWQRSAGVKHETSRLSSGGLITRLYIRIFFGQKTDWLNRVRCCCNPTIECLFSRGKHLRPVGVISDYSFTRIDCLTVIQSFASVHYYWPTAFFPLREQQYVGEVHDETWRNCGADHSHATDKRLGYLQCVDRYLQNVLAFCLAICLSPPAPDHYSATSGDNHCQNNNNNKNAFYFVTYFRRPRFTTVSGML